MPLLDFFKKAGSLFETLGRGMGDALWVSPTEQLAERWGVPEEEAEDFFKTQKETRAAQLERLKNEVEAHEGEMESRKLLNEAHRLQNEQNEASALAQAGEYGIPMIQRMWKLGLDAGPEATGATKVVEPDRLHRIASEFRRLTDLGEEQKGRELGLMESQEKRLGEGLKLQERIQDWRESTLEPKKPERDPMGEMYHRLFEFFYKQTEDPEEAQRMAEEGIQSIGDYEPSGGGPPPPGPERPTGDLATALEKEKLGISRDLWTSAERLAWLQNRYK